MLYIRHHLVCVVWFAYRVMHISGRLFLSSDFVNHVDHLKSLQQTFVMNTKEWEALSPPVALNWEQLKFTSANLASVPEDSGVYAFVIKSENANLPIFSYLMYIGIAGYKENSPRTLRDRYKNYIKEEADLIRPKVHYMLSKYQGNVYFFYVPIDKTKCELQKLETMLNDALIPPCNENDFSGEMRKKVKALGL